MPVEILAMSELVLTPLLHESIFRVHPFTGDLRSPAGAYSSLIRGIAAPGNIKLDTELLSALPAVEIISIFGAGYDGIDLEEARRRGLLVANTPDVLTNDVADLAIALWIAVSRRILDADRYARSGAWSSQGQFPLAGSASHRSAGIVGFGRIGAAIAKRCRAMDMQIHYYSRTQRANGDARRWSDLEEMACAVDVLFVTCPSTPETFRLINRDVILALGPNGTLVNVSRGNVVDERSLVEALLAGRLGAAALDVFDREPDIPAELAVLQNVVVTPHIGSATKEARAAMARQMTDNLRGYFEGGRISNRLV